VPGTDRELQILLGCQLLLHRLCLDEHVANVAKHCVVRSVGRSVQQSVNGHLSDRTCGLFIPNNRHAKRTIAGGVLRGVHVANVAELCARAAIGGDELLPLADLGLALGLGVANPGVVKEK
jgi:hypothetical protein